MHNNISGLQFQGRMEHMFPKWSGPALDPSLAGNNNSKFCIERIRGRSAFSQFLRLRFASFPMINWKIMDNKLSQSFLSLPCRYIIFCTY